MYFDVMPTLIYKAEHQESRPKSGITYVPGRLCITLHYSDKCFQGENFSHFTRVKHNREDEF